MLVIDGSFGEGGGQILRTTIALSSLLLRPVKIINIRAKRRNPGLQMQHITAVKVLATLTNATVKGLYKGSMVLEFVPRERRYGSFEFNIGTAGSISLVLQASLPVMLFAPGEVRLKIKGGTDVSWSPPIDYVKNVLVPILEKMGAHVEVNVLRRGHYPKGGGIVEVRTKPVRKLSPLICVERGSVLAIEGISHAVRLPKHVAERQAKSAKQFLEKHGYRKVSIRLEYYEHGKDLHLGPGSGIVLWALTERSIIGADALGARGKPAEVVGREAAEKLVKALSTKACYDKHMGDMIIPFLAMADGISEISASELTMHTITNIEVVKKLAEVDIELEGGLGKPFKLRVKGLGLRP